MSSQQPSIYHHSQQWMERFENLEKTEGWKEIILPMIEKGVRDAKDNILDPKNDSNPDVILVEKGKYRAYQEILDFISRQKENHKKNIGRSSPHP